MGELTALGISIVEEDVLAGPGGVGLGLALWSLDQVDLLAEGADGSQQLLVWDLDGVVLVVVSVLLVGRSEGIWLAMTFEF